MNLKLSYIAIETNKFEQWKEFSRVIGYQFETSEDAAFLRMDEKERRILLVKGDSEDYAFCGLEASSEDHFWTLVDKLKSEGIEVSQGAPEGTKLRAVEKYVSFIDPAGLTVEICLGSQNSDSEFASPSLPAGFVTGELGMGHIAFAVPNNRESEEFYIRVLGARISDHINTGMAGGTVELSFIHFNPRHHTFAFASAEGIPPEVVKANFSKRINHFMCELPHLSDVLRAQARLKEANYPMALTLGEHPNDRDISFYVVTPSGFALELGAGAIHIDDDTWVPERYDVMSLWGHEFQL
jgi:2,3-dihydroxybiphenyl 1,2-dioxygenase